MAIDTPAAAGRQTRAAESVWSRRRPLLRAPQPWQAGGEQAARLEPARVGRHSGTAREGRKKGTGGKKSNRFLITNGRWVIFSLKSHWKQGRRCFQFIL